MLDLWALILSHITIYKPTNRWPQSPPCPFQLCAEASVNRSKNSIGYSQSVYLMYQITFKSCRCYLHPCNYSLKKKKMKEKKSKKETKLHKVKYLQKHNTDMWVCITTRPKKIQTLWGSLSWYFYLLHFSSISAPVITQLVIFLMVKTSLKTAKKC